MLVAAATVLAYYPGLAGPFLLDDFGSIRPLGDFGGVRDWESFKAFVFGGNAGPTGRPLSLLSFLIDATNWPADARSFKQTNLIIHLLNGIVLGFLVTSILRVLDFDQSDARWIALVVSALWLLHPFLVSTTLYIVQRMAQLATFFMFAGLAAWVYFRTQLVDAPRRAYIGMSVAIACFTGLAMFSKENGILLPVLVGVIEITVFATGGDKLGKLDRRWAGLFIILPLCVISLYLGEKFFRPSFLEAVPPRDFSIYERLITQPRVLVDYLYNWFIPKLYTTGVFQDHIVKSTGLLSPVTTIVSVFFHGVLLWVAIAKRRKWPMVSLAVLFFYGCHLLESTVLNLELYFEHRNYNAVAFAFLPLVVVGWRILNVRAFWVATIGVVVLLGSFTRFSATVWQALPTMLEASAVKAPTSARAQAQFATLLEVAGQSDRALDVINKAIERIPGARPLLLLNRMLILCNRGELDSAAFKRDTNKLVALPFDSRGLKAYRIFTHEVVTGTCSDISPQMLSAVFQKMLDVPVNGDSTTLQHSHVKFLIGYTKVYTGEPAAALDAFQASLRARRGASHAMAMASVLASHAYPEEALILADAALIQLHEEMADNTRLTSKLEESDIIEFQETVRGELAAQQADDTGGPDD